MDSYDSFYGSQNCVPPTDEPNSGHGVKLSVVREWTKLLFEGWIDRGKHKYFLLGPCLFVKAVAVVRVA